MGIVNWFWASLRRSADMQMLWPACRKEAPDLDHAKAAFLSHALRDPAWKVLGEEEIFRRIDKLS